MNKYYYTIGLEVHAELRTNAKMFCGCKNDPDEDSPNVNICPVCMAHPGAIPVPNKKAIEEVIRVGLAVDGKIADFTEFDRKSYFYPDIPKGYQISQYEHPIVKGGKLAGMDITRIHLEEDTGTNKHDRGDFSLVDFNRAGVPLMELVTEPHTFETMEEASLAGGSFGREYQLLLQYLGASLANMEKGEFRLEANISLFPEKNKLGTKVEVKNLNSFKSAERAIIYELDRMQELHESGRASEIVQETRGWDDGKQSTFSQRAKDNVADYRYFPDPDIPKLKLTEIFDIEKIRSELPELPSSKRSRYSKEYGIKEGDIEAYINDHQLGVWFEEISKILITPDKIKIASNYITSDFLGLKKVDSSIVMPSASNFAELINLVNEGKLTSRVAKDILAIIVKQDGSPLKIATEQNLIQKNDEGALKAIASNIISSNEKVVADYKSGKEASLQFLVGQMMKETKGSANPAIASKILKELLA
ncbi:MAG: Asp-tRNA(Asn)/Glu-tRNA(Gln) amidotransferase subunit GatB [Candidatus Pacebacteria bacterium]|nr:Asp-tRNA(Asn)/Glu-tRNA(Gln) amidotransferase subunit GatB [Candidatus Paceibacterota bacterium]